MLTIRTHGACRQAIFRDGRYDPFRELDRPLDYACCAAVPGITNRETCARRTATGMKQETGTIITGFELPARAPSQARHDHGCDHHQCAEFDQEPVEEPRPGDAFDAQRQSVALRNEGACRGGQRHKADSFGRGDGGQCA